MQLYDVGFSSMAVQECDNLAELALVLGRDGEAAELKSRGDAMRANIAANLWDPVGGIYTNRFPNGTFYRRISPTSFYAMMAKAATDEQAESMIQHWMLNRTRFCVNLEWPGNNTDDCYWGLHASLLP